MGCVGDPSRHVRPLNRHAHMDHVFHEIMNVEHLTYIACPRCHGDVRMASVATQAGDRVIEGVLECVSCSSKYPVIRAIPRFVPLDNYASGFGLEWTKHARTQYDSENGLTVSEERFFQETRWPRSLKGQVVFEAGSGSGRFTEQAVKTGAMVVSLDYSYAVDANYRSNGAHGNLLIVQGDIVSPPIRPGSVDKCCCIGVLQHTPDPRRSFASLVETVKPGGSIVVDTYKKVPLWKRWFYTKYLVRPFLAGMDPQRLYRWCERYVDLMWPVARLISRLPFGRQLNWFLLIADYRGMYALNEHQLKEWALLDTFDMLAPAYDLPQTLDDFHRWFVEERLGSIDVHYGYNGIEGRATIPVQRPAAP